MTCWLGCDMMIEIEELGWLTMCLWGWLTDREIFKHFSETKVWKHMKPEE